MVKIKRFSSILNTKLGNGFKADRNYDQDLNRLGRGESLRELSNLNQFHKEMSKLKNELEEMKKQR